MAEETVRVLRIEVGDSQKTVKGLRKDVAELRDTLLNLDKGTEAYEKTVAELAAKENELKSVMSATKTTADAAEGSYAQLQQRMKQLRAEWRATGDDAKRAALGQEINKINDQLKAYDKTIGDSYRNVGNYPKEELVDAFRGVKDEIKQYRSELLTLDEGSEQYYATLQKLADAQFKLRDMNELAGMSANDLGEKLNTLNRLAAGVASGFGAVQGFMALVGAESKDVDKIMLKLQATIAFVQGVQGLEGLNKTLTAARLQFRGLLSFIPKVITSLHGLKAALVSTGIGAFAVAIGVVIANWDKLDQLWKGAPSQLDRVRNKIDEVNESLEASGKAADLSAAGLDAYIQALKDGAEAAEAMTAAEQAMRAERHTAMIIQRADLEEEIATLKERNQAYKEYYDKLPSWQQESVDRQKAKNDAAIADAERAIKRLNVALSQIGAEGIDADKIAKEAEEAAKKAAEAAREQARHAAEELKTDIKNLLGDDTSFDPAAAVEKIQDWYEAGYITMEQYAKGMADYSAKESVLPNIMSVDNAGVSKLIDDRIKNNAKLVKADEKVNKQIEALGKKQTKQREEDEQTKIDATKMGVSATAEAAGNLSTILGEETAAGKAFAIAQATISTYQAGAEVLASQKGPLWTRIAAMTAIITAGLAQVKQIVSVSPNGSVSGGSGTGGYGMTPPAFVAAPVTYTRNIQTEEEIDRANTTPVVKAYVVEGELTDAQRKALARKKNSTF